ncbi:adenylate/guanylate cyclase domain-containing protein [Desulfococcaceae bacterium HSG8]|nr:adenylate/guanylate cyclase domain-containing protein [Desulfococcaceae bacterium HSG8]
MQPVIVCVDDEEIVLETIKEQLKVHLYDCTIEVAESGEEALELLEELIEGGIEIPLVISDQIMPGLKGDEFLKRVHIRLPRTLKILMTGRASADDVGNAVNRAKLYRYIGKPWDEADLTLTVREALRSYFQDKDLGEKNKELRKLNQELRQKAETFCKFVPVRFLELLNCNKNDFEQIELGLCSECNLSVLFSDIRSFTRFSEGITLEENFRFLNSYISQMGPIIRKYSGFIDKYIGDAIMGLFEDADQALQTANEMLLRLQEYNEGRNRAGYIPISIGIGINTGQLMMGTIGEDDRMETTVIGDVVNLASRIESLTKHYGIPLLISEHTFCTLKNPDRYCIRFIGRTKVKGKEDPIRIFEVFDGDLPEVRDGKTDSMKIFDEAMQLYDHRDFEDAQKLFEECFRKNSGDSIAQVYIKRCRKVLFSILEC